MKILLTGANGLLGQNLVYSLFMSGHTVVATGKGPCRFDYSGSDRVRYYELDIVDYQDWKRLQEREESFDQIIHGAALTQVDHCELNKEEAYNANVKAVQYLLELFEPQKTPILYVSTDFVFDGKSGPYRETDAIGPLSVYARSKAEAEKIVQESGIPWAILRTMIIYGVTDDAQRSNVVLWTKQSLEQGKDINVINDQFRGPTLAEDLAQACIHAALKKAQGIYHVSGREVLSILEIVQAVADHFGLDKKHIHPISTASLNQPAARPLKTGFIIEKAEQELDYRPHSLQEGLKIVESQLRLKHP